MRGLTPLERMFEEEFCRFSGLETRGMDDLRVSQRNCNPVGFMTMLDLRTVPAQLRWDFGVFDTPRVAVVGPDRMLCGSLLFFDKETRALDAIEGFVYGEAWPNVEEPLFWSETNRVAGQKGRH